MKFPFLKPKPEWQSPSGVGGAPSTSRRTFINRLPGLVVMLLLGFLVYYTNGATWAVRLTMCLLFCSLIYTRDNSPTGRWVAIGIIAVGTLLLILLPLLGIGTSVLRNVF